MCRGLGDTATELPVPHFAVLWAEPFADAPFLPFEQDGAEFAESFRTVDEHLASDQLSVGLRHPEVNSMPRIEGDRVGSGPEYSFAVDQIVSEREEPHVFGGWPVSTVGGCGAGCGTQKSGRLVDRDPVYRTDQMCSLKNVAAVEQLVAPHGHIRFGGTADQCVLVVQADEGADVTARVCLGYLVEQDTALHSNHSPESAKGGLRPLPGRTVLYQLGRDS